ncbi:TPA: helix-turn-helix transcriptional regulator [Staphylococcus delphini]|nr:helix-turn-helix transcriptional regulator [Staphylococcus delphini]HEC2168291.1 helix-turn-helix transcriptional regulator [Staphylococcus delphini]HEC2186545.1 helix-turn-helix transcriptional regulator [Staphylococcus delphini]HEC2194180.1 helix-turn-helix transcriptional regulator [Staphylococcus delphini]HEC2197941.1 helix-turn-helix transcriptional regulator [Staphylococcus delphini]
MDKRHIKLRLLLDEKGLKHKEVAEMINMTPALFSQKINRNKSDFTLVEASKICDVLGISMDDYFFVSDVSKMRNKITNY